MEKACMNGCGTMLQWDALKSPPPNTQRAKDGKIGWWVETLTKKDHDCPKKRTENKIQQYLNTEIRTVWTTADIDEKGEELIEGFNAFDSIAYILTKNKHPDLSDQSDKFGMIQHTIRSDLIQLALIRATKPKEDSF